MTIDSFHAVLRTSHIGLGVVALLLFWVPALTRKGSRIHIASGRLFGYLSYAIAATAAISCIWAIALPLSFTGITRSLGAEEQSRLFGGVRFLFVILFTLMTWLVAGTRMGTHVVRNKGDFRVDSMSTKLCWIFSGATSFICGLFGTGLIMSGDFNGLLPLFLAWVGTSDARKNLSVLSHPIPSPHFWVEKHFECMIGSGVAMHTAFLVFGANRLLNIQQDSLLALVPWFLPAVIGVSVFTFLSRQHRKSPLI